MRPTTLLSRVRPLLLVGSAAAVATLLATACSGTPTSPSGVSNANLKILLTDAPIDDVQKVNIYFTSLTVKPEGKPVKELTLQLPQNPIDLLTLDNTVVNLAAGVVEPGTYEFMHINIDERRSNLVESTVQKSLRVPSEEIKILSSFTVGTDRTTTLTLDFDAKSSLVRLGNGEWLLRPVIVMTGNNTSSQP
jgi:hypothetical protein